MARTPTTGRTQIAYRIAQSNGFSTPRPQGMMGMGAKPAKAAQPAQPAQPMVDVAGWSAYRDNMLAGRGAAGAAGQPGAPAPPVDPMAKVKDSGYYSNLAQGIANRTTGLAGLNLSDQRLGEDRDTSLGRLARQFAQQQTNIKQGSNKQGLFYSGQLGKRLGDAETVYKDQTTDINLNAARGLENNQGTRDSLTRQYGDPSNPEDHGVGGMTALSDAAGRYQQQHPVPDAVLGRPGENGLPQGFNQGGWGGLAPGWTVEWDPITGKAKRLVKQ